MDSIPKCQVPGCCNDAQATGRKSSANIEEFMKANPEDKWKYRTYRKSKWVREKYNVADGWVCNKHHNEYIREKNDGKSMKEIFAANAGFSTVVDWEKHKAENYFKTEFGTLQDALDAGFKTFADYIRHQELKKAIEAGFETIADWKRDLDLKSAKAAGFDCITEWKNSKHRYLKFRKDYCENIDGRLGFVCTMTPPTPEQLLAMGLKESFKAFLHVDHINGDPYDDRESNLQTLCPVCHCLKTFANGDNLSAGRKSKKITLKVA